MNSSEDVHSWSPHSSQSHESTADMVAAGRMSTVPYNLSSTSGHLDWNITASAEKKLAMEVMYIVGRKSTAWNNKNNINSFIITT